jgi:DNA-binding GntR family transcriptional regulator
LHEFIIEKSANESLRHLLDTLTRQVQLIRAFGNRQPQVAEDAAISRHAFLQAMLRRDSAAAEALLEEHINQVRLAVISNLADQESLRLEIASSA